MYCMYCITCRKSLLDILKNTIFSISFELKIVKNRKKNIDLNYSKGLVTFCSLYMYDYIFVYVLYNELLLSLRIVECFLRLSLLYLCTNSPVA